jgi:hypothetical protein
MRKTMIFALVWLAITAGCAFSAETSDIILDDGSVIRADVVSLQDGVYTLRSSSMGDFKIDANRVSQINRHRDGQSPAAALPGQSDQMPFASREEFKAKVETTQAALMNDPEAMKAAARMAAKPEFQKLLQDPEALAALKSGDTETLMKKPSFQAIMNDPEMKGMAESMMNKTGDK